jgi:hypothetical protein
MLFVPGDMVLNDSGLPHPTKPYSLCYNTKVSGQCKFKRDNRSSYGWSDRCLSLLLECRGMTQKCSLDPHNQVPPNGNIISFALLNFFIK